MQFRPGQTMTIPINQTTFSSIGEIPSYIKSITPRDSYTHSGIQHIIADLFIHGGVLNAEKYYQTTLSRSIH